MQIQEKVAVYDQIRAEAESIRNDEPATIALIEPGDVVRQGDLYLVMLTASLGGNLITERQLASGTTQGSRHVVEGHCQVLIVDHEVATRAIHKLIPSTCKHELFVGPQIVATQPVTITHPEHGDRTLPEGSYLVLYQRAWADTVRRTMD